MRIVRYILIMLMMIAVMVAVILGTAWTAGFLSRMAGPDYNHKTTCHFTLGPAEWDHGTQLLELGECFDRADYYEEAAEAYSQGIQAYSQSLCYYSRAGALKCISRLADLKLRRARILEFCWLRGRHRATEILHQVQDVNTYEGHR